MPESRGKFEMKFRKLIEEDMTAAGVVGGSVGGFNPDSNINSTDFYAPGDARRPQSIFAGVLTRKGLSKKRKRRKKRARTKKH